MHFCTDEEYEEFFRSMPEFEKMLVRSGIQIVKYWFSITYDEQEVRFQARIEDPLKQWKLSPMDLENRRRWEALYGREGNHAGAHEYSGSAVVGRTDGGQEARAAQLHSPLAESQVPYTEIEHQPVLLPSVFNPDYLRQPVPEDMYVPEVLIKVSAAVAAGDVFDIVAAALAHDGMTLHELPCLLRSLQHHDEHYLRQIEIVRDHQARQQHQWQHHRRLIQLSCDQGFHHRLLSIG